MKTKHRPTTTGYRIDKNIKMPAVQHAVSSGLPSKAGLTLAGLEKGDSFLIRDALDAIRAEKVMRDMNGRHRNVKAFAARKVKGGTRFWRLK